MMVLVKPFGPHQRTRCSGSVQALKTKSRGASKTRVMTSSRFSASVAIAAALFLVSIFLLLRLQFAQVLVEAIQTLFPEAPIVFDPFGRILQRSCSELTRPPLRFAPPRDQPGAFQHLEMFGERGKANLERLGQIGHRGCALGEARENRTPGGIRERGEGGVQLFGRCEMLNHLVK